MQCRPGAAVLIPQPLATPIGVCAAVLLDASSHWDVDVAIGALSRHSNTATLQCQPVWAGCKFSHGLSSKSSLLK
eukprot:15033394-Alexandrium_andersonii.AAC.1